MTTPDPTWLPSHYGNEWRWTHQIGLELVITNVTPEKRALPAWIEMRWSGQAPPNPGVIHAGTKNLMGANTARDLAGRIQTRTADHSSGIEWQELCDAAVYDVVRNHLDGPAAQTLSTAIGAPPGFLIRPLINRARATSIIGGGGTYKSMLALATGITVSTGNNNILDMNVIDTGPVFYCDWEANAGTHRMRLEALCHGVDMEVPGEELQYINAVGQPLAMWAQALKRRVDEANAALVVIDSVMLARGGEASAADNIAFFASLAELDTPTLLVDHKSWEKLKTGDVGAYGSIVNNNTIGLSWETKGDANTGRVTLFPGKNNDFPPGTLPTIGLRFTADTNNEQRMTSAKWTHDTPMNRTQASPKAEAEYRDQIYAWLEQHGQNGISAISRGLGLSKSTVSRTLRSGERDVFREENKEWTPIPSTEWDDLPNPY